VTETVNQTEDKDARLDESAKIISSACKWSAAAGFIPVPYLDMAGLAAVQVQMVNDLAALHGKSVKDDSVKTAVAALLGTLAPVGLAAPLAISSVKLIPGLGSIAGGLSLSALGAAATFAVGKVFVNHFEGGGALSDFDVENVKEEVKQTFKDKTAKA
tara:strand:- start:3560 stop:4033 length:474 start_codon:yes stop_codon:yes gene_type:complete